MPAEPEGLGVATEFLPPGAPPKKTGSRWGAQPPPTSDSEKDSGFSDTSSEDLSGQEQTDMKEPPSPSTQPAPPQHPLTALAPGHPFAHLAPVYLVHSLLLQQPLGLPPQPWQLLLLQPPLPAVPCHKAIAARCNATTTCHEATTPATPVRSPGCRNRRLGATAELLQKGGLLAVALRTGALLRQNQRTQREIAALRRHIRLLAHAARDPRAWPRLCRALGGGSSLGPPAPCQEPPTFGEGVGAGGM
ncbi:uncharacterized protein [Numenius arquata]|uniref:uncharacterized protein n=1 Tax=Numenius arquata TaxID=31919 RepID=UPI003D30CCFE